jgi:NAD(P)-dependent dehydrogenase (short-subunit alcohol dehydrogenase family)
MNDGDSNSSDDGSSSSSSSSSMVWTWLALTSGGTPPLVAVLYKISVWITYAINHETPWFPRKWPASSVLFDFELNMWIGIVVGLASAVVVGVNVDDSSSFDRRYYFLIIPPLVLANTLLSIKMMVKIRRNDVVGVASPPFHGPAALRGKVVLVTGANNGIGRETVHQLASMGAAKVVLLCRDEGRANEAMEDLRSRLAEQRQPRNDDGHPPCGIDGGDDQLVFVPLDLADFASIRRAVPAIRKVLEGSTVTPDGEAAGEIPNQKKMKKIDVLINNAGLMMGHHSLSTDGFEVMMQANHLGHYLLTRLLLEEDMLRVTMTAEGNHGDNDGCTSRIINLTSSLHEAVPGRFDFEDMFCDRGLRPYTMFGQYAMTKLANILMTKELARRYPQMKVFAVHPGIVRTNVTSNMPWYLRIPNYVFGIFVAALQKTAAEGAYSTVFCAAAPWEELPPSGTYILNCRPWSTGPATRTQADMVQLWRISADLVGLPTEDDDKDGIANSSSDRDHDGNGVGRQDAAKKGA